MLLDEIKKREEREEREKLEKSDYVTSKDSRELVKEIIMPIALLLLIFSIMLAWLAVKGFDAERESETYTKIEHVTYIKPYKYETIKKSWVDSDGNINKQNLLKVYKQDGMKNDLPHWKYVKTVDYGEKKPNV